ncbi:chaperone [Lithospermum erythrorhizon]|uniref:peptidylprolyl isomerase n=1 Tax=Lithospermum erythrorhizon TaxID=34254 RepID=A0AAV3PUD8_LITER
MVTFSTANAAAFIDSDDDSGGEVIESAPPLKVGESRLISSFGITKKLLKHGHGWETPGLNDDVTIDYEGRLLDGTKFISTRDKGEPFICSCNLLLTGLTQGVITMTKGEISLFTLPPELGYGAAGTYTVPPNSILQFEVELLSWITVVDVSKDGAIVKKIIKRGEDAAPPTHLDQVHVRYTARLPDDTIVADTLEKGVEFLMNQGHFCPALPRVLKTMKRGEKVNLCVQPQYAFGEFGRDSTTDFPSIPPNSVLSIQLELVQVKPVIDISGDSKVLKKILKEGDGLVTADDGASVIVKYTAMLEDGTIFDKKGFDGEEPMEFVTDEEQVIVGLDRTASTMRKGEQASVTIKPEYGFGCVEVKGDLAVVPANSTIIYEVEMLDFTREKAPWELCNNERIEAADKKKEEGNELFKTGKYERAGKKYEKAMGYISEDLSFAEDEQKLVKSLSVSCWLNCAACRLKLNNFQEAVKLCSKVLDVEYGNVKALYRRAQAYIESADLHLAELDITKALEIDPQNRGLKLLQKKLKQLQVESNKRDAALYASMFKETRKDSSITKETSITSKRPRVEKSAESRDSEVTERTPETAEVSTVARDGDSMVVDSC